MNQPHKHLKFQQKQTLSVQSTANSSGQKFLRETHVVSELTYTSNIYIKSGVQIPEALSLVFNVSFKILLFFAQ